MRAAAEVSSADRLVLTWHSLLVCSNKMRALQNKMHIKGADTKSADCTGLLPLQTNIQKWNMHVPGSVMWQIVSTVAMEVRR